MFSKEELIKALYKEIERGKKSDKHYWRDIGHELGLCDGVISVETDLNEYGPEKYHIKVTVLNVSYRIGIWKNDTEKFVDQYWDIINDIYEDVQKIIKDRKYYKKRWRLVFSNEVIKIQSYCCSMSICTDPRSIYKEITGRSIIDDIKTVYSIDKSIDLIESIDDDVWLLGLFFNSLETTIITRAIQSITKDGDKIIIKKDPSFDFNIIVNDSLRIAYEKLFEKSNNYIINSNETEDLITSFNLLGNFESVFEIIKKYKEV